MPKQSVSIEWDMGTIRLRTKALGHVVDKGIAAVMSKKAVDVQDYARSNAPWTDRTGNARNGLFATSRSGQGTHEIVLYHTVPYGIWLEVRFAGRNAIIRPTIQSQAPLVMKAIEGMLSKIGAVA